MHPFTLSAERGQLRPVAPYDEDAVFLACQDPEVLRWTAALPAPYTRADAAEYVHVIAPEGWASDRAYTWAIAETDGTELLGVVGLDGPRSGRPEIGYWLAERARGSGLMATAVAAVCRCAFERLDAQAVLWRALVGNEPSRRVAERVGFRMGEPVRRGLEQRGHWRDAWTATLLPGDEPVLEPPALTDGTVTLRRWEPTDLRTLAGLVDDAVLEWTTFPGRAPEQLGDWLAVNRRLRRAPDARFAIADASGEAVGSLRLGFDARIGVVNLGWWLGAATRGRGYARRALDLVLPWAAAQGAVRFVAEIYVGNDASVVLAERLGMRCEGRRRGHWPPREPGHLRRDTLVYGLVPDDAGWPDRDREGAGS